MNIIERNIEYIRNKNKWVCNAKNIMCVCGYIMLAYIYNIQPVFRMSSQGRWFQDLVNDGVLKLRQHSHVENIAQFL